MLLKVYYWVNNVTFLQETFIKNQLKYKRLVFTEGAIYIKKTFILLA